MEEALAAAVGPWWIVWAVAVAVLGVGRWSRLVTYDTFPPAAAARQWWANRTKNHVEWGNLAFCPWCFTPWLMLVCIGWFALTFLAVWIAWAWWLFWGWGALAYVASMVIARDEPADSES